MNNQYSSKTKGNKVSDFIQNLVNQNLTVWEVEELLSKNFPKLDKIPPQITQVED